MSKVQRIFFILIILTNLSYIFCRLIYPPFFHYDEFGSIQREARDAYRYARKKESREAAKSDKANCNDDKLIQFLAEIQVFNPESILKIATVEELHHMCKKVSENMDKTEKYISTCTPPHQGDLYMQLIKGVNSLYQKLCVNEEFKKKFETYHKCLQEMHAEFEDCNGPADWNEDSDAAKICAAYKDIADCYYIKAAKVCGKDAASTMKELMIAIINSIITVKCNVGSNPSVKDAMPPSYIKAKNAKVCKNKPLLRSNHTADNSVGNSTASISRSDIFLDIISLTVMLNV